MLIKRLFRCKYSKILHNVIILRFFYQKIYYQEKRFLAPRPLLHQQQKKSHSEEQLFLWCHQESNRGHKDFQSFALPTELWHQFLQIRYCALSSGATRNQTGDTRPKIFSAQAFALSTIRVVPPGIEPGTQGFSVLCSTN